MQHKRSCMPLKCDRNLMLRARSTSCAGGVVKALHVGRISERQAGIAAQRPVHRGSKIVGVISRTGRTARGCKGVDSSEPEISMRLPKAAQLPGPPGIHPVFRGSRQHAAAATGPPRVCEVHATVLECI